MPGEKAMPQAWRFIDSVRVLVQPDRTFSRIMLRRDIIAASVTMGLSTSVIAAGIVVLYKMLRVPSLAVPGFWGAAIVLASSAAAFVLCTAGTVFLDAIYAVALKRNGKPLIGDRRAHWCCRACLMPWWLLFFCLLGWLPLPRVSALSLMVLIAVAVRLIDLESRLLTHVYRMPLLQAYVVVLLEAIFVIVGVMIGLQLPPPPAVPMPRMVLPLPPQ